MIYLKKVFICLRRQEYWGEAERLAERMRAEGLECRTAEACLNAGGCAGSGDAAEEGMTGEIPRREREDALWVTDVSQIARRLLEEGGAVLAFLHNDNYEGDFSGCRYACEELGELDVDCLDRVYRRYRRLPWDILETERCLVRESTEEDVEDFYRIYSEPSITRYMEKLFEDPQEEREYVRDYIDQVYSFYNFGIWTVVEKNSGEVIGRAGICYREGYEDPELGFIIALPWQGRGIATEVCTAILRYVREEFGFSRILAFVQPENAVSMHLCKKFGVEIVPIFEN